MKRTVWAILSCLSQWLIISTQGEQVGGQAHVKEQTPCSCDCCGVLLKDGKMQCAPIALITTADEELHKLASECPEMCGKEDDGSFLGTGLIDASRYCLNSCSSVVDIPDTQCVESGELKKIKPHKKSTNAFLRHAKKKKSITREMYIDDEISIAEAKARMMKARSQAVAAGEAAKRSKMGYELVRRSARKAAEEVGLATINEIKREARREATEAKDIRERYVASAIKNAQNAAYGMAKIYKDSLLKAQKVTGTWATRASQYGTAASQRKQMSIDMAKTAQGYIGAQEYKEAQDYMLQSQQAMQQANDFATKAASAHKTAKELNAALPWYLYAESAAAANALVANTPLDIPVPNLPPLP